MGLALWTPKNKGVIMKTIPGLELEKSKISTSHITHFILTLLTGGFWAIIWIIATFRNQNKIKKIDREILELKIRDEHNLKQKA